MPTRDGVPGSGIRQIAGSFDRNSGEFRYKMRRAYQ